MIFYNFKGVNPSRRHKKTHTHLTAETPKKCKARADRINEEIHTLSKKQMARSIFLTTDTTATQVN